MRTTQQIEAELKAKRWALLKVRAKIVFLYFIGLCMVWDLIDHLHRAFCGH